MIRWGIVGLGRAATARRRVISAREDSVIIHESSRRDQLAPTLEDVFASDVDAVALCRESSLHAADVLAGLSAKKHILVEYPLAFTGAEAMTIRQAALDSKRVLHVGHFGLLNPFHDAVRTALKESQLTAFHYHFSGGYGRAVQPLGAAGLWGQAANSRLQALWSWFGPLSFESAEIDAKMSGYVLTVRLRSSDGIEVTLEESRLAGQQRGRAVSCLGRDGGRPTLPRWTPWRGGFAMDTQRFVDQMAGRQPGAYLAVSDIVEVVGLGEMISQRAQLI